jgi:hypothetical protein
VNIKVALLKRIIFFGDCECQSNVNNAMKSLTAKIVESTHEKVHQIETLANPVN